MKKNKNIIVFSHILVWLVLFSMPYLLSYGQGQEFDRLVAHTWIPLVFYMGIFYVNYAIVIERFLFQKKTGIFILTNIVLITFFIILREAINTAFFDDLLKRPDSGKGGPPLKLIIYIQVLSYMAPLLFSIALKTTERWMKTQVQQKEAAHVQLQSELQHLRYQLQPHFFFNSLNNIYSLVDISPEHAKETIHSLSKLMRYLLYETNTEMVSLSKEIDFMKKYIELMKLRLTDKTEIKASFPEKVEVSTIQMAPLLFISLIENAFKHGVSASKSSKIEINMTTNNNKVLFAIENDDFPKKGDDKSGSGIGLQNLKKRLQLLYPGKFDFHTETKNNRFSIQLQIET